MRKISHFAVFIASIFLISSLFYGCAIIRQVNATALLLQTRLGIKELEMDSLRFNQDIVELVNRSKNGMFPDKQVVSLARDFAKNKLEIEIGKAFLGTSLNINNKADKPYWLVDFRAEIQLEDIRLPIYVDKEYRLDKGETEVQLTTEFPLDARLFHLLDVERCRISGSLYVALEENGTPVPFHFNVSYKIKPEQKKAIVNKAKEMILKLLANGAGSILSKGLLKG